ncbi:MAG: hypothetical protein Kow0042_21640 [Calditrichia bacterium]
MNLKNLFFILFLLFICLDDLKSQEAVQFPIYVDTVFVVGNKKTHEEVILREIPFTLPDSMDETDFRTIKNRITNLFLFNRVELQLTRVAGRVALIIMVTESWYIYPVPLLFINERDWDKLSYGMQFSHFNFRGRNEKLSLGGWLGYNPGFFINYYNPWLGKETRLILGISLSHNRVANKIFDFDQIQSSLKLTLGRQFTLRFSTALTFSLQQIKLPGGYQQFSLSGNGTDFVPAISYRVTYDNRDLREYPRRGFFHQSSFQRTGLTNRQPRFWRFQFDNRAYIPLYKLISLGARNYLLINEGSLPIYDRSFLGYSERIRGYYDRIFPPLGQYRNFDSPQLMLNSLEIRFPLLPVRYFTWKNAPFFASLYKDLKFGISGGVFIDSGTAWQQTRQLSLSKFFTGYGLGLHIHLPYANVLRIEHAWSDEGQGQWIVDVNVYF